MAYWRNASLVLAALIFSAGGMVLCYLLFKLVLG
jgi:hypothetical protein